MKSILLTGATGFLGSQLLEKFLQNGYEIVILKRSFSSTKRIDQYLSSITYFDIDQTTLSNVFKNCDIDVVVHTACNYGRNGEDASEVVLSNIQFGLELMEEAIRHGAKTFINTDSLLPKYINPYSLSKAQFKEWLYLFSNKIQVINFKIEHMYGPGDDSRKFVPWLIQQMLTTDNDIPLTSGVQMRDFVHVCDIATAFDLVLSRAAQLEPWNEYDLGTGQLIRVRDFVEAIAKELEQYKSVRLMPRLLFGQVPYRENEVMEPKVDNSKLRQLGWEPRVSIQEGIKEIVKQY